MSRPGDDVCFDWRTNRRHGELAGLIAGFGGGLQSDGYEAYAPSERAHPEVAWVGCWAHARRNIIEAQGENPKASRVALKLIGRLNRLEREWDGADHAAGRERNIAERSRPKSGLGVTSGYLLSRWTPLCRHVDHGQTRLDNNQFENAIRATALGTKNWLFIGHPDAGRRAAILYSLTSQTHLILTARTRRRQSATGAPLRVPGTERHPLRRKTRPELAAQLAHPLDLQLQGDASTRHPPSLPAARITALN